MTKDKDKHKRKKRAIQMLASGLNQSEVAKKLNVTRQTISYWWKDENFKSEVNKLRDEKDETLLPDKQDFIPQSIDDNLDYKVQSREYYFKKEIELLNKIENSILPLLKENSIRAATVLLKLSERRSRLLALDVTPIPEHEAILRLIEGDLLPLEIQKQVLPVFENCQSNLKDVFNSKFQIN